MPIYKQTTEITNIDDIWTGVNKDIVEIYFGNKNVFTVWGEYEGTLPATINANGADMRQYRIYGAAGGVGDRTAQLFDAVIDQGSFITTSGQEYNSETRIRSKFEDNPLTAGTYTIDASGVDDVVVYVYDAEKQYVQSASIIEWQSLPFTFTVSVNVYARFAFRYSDNSNITPANISNIILAEGSTAPASFVPFGYEVDMVSRTRNLFSSIWEQGSINATTGQNEQSSTRVRTEGYIEVIPNKIYSFSRSIYKEFMNVRFYSSDKSFIGVGSTSTIRLIAGGNEGNPMLANQPFCCFEVIDTNIKYMRIGDQSNNLATKYMMVEGEYTRNTMPDYEPYSNTTTPVYIGDVPLEKDEYVDYAEGKIYRLSENLWNVNGRTTNQNGDERPGNEFEAGGIYKIANESSSTIYYRLGTETTAATPISAGVSVNITATNKLLVWSPTQSLMPYITAQLVGVPTDPPVPLPALPTCEGTTIVDYEGSGTAPEKAILKYRKKNF